MTERNLVILAEDNPNVLESFQNLLKVLDYEVIPCADGDIALDAIKQLSSEELSHALLITDLSMPETSGDKLAKELKAENIILPIMLHSGNDITRLGEDLKTQNIIDHYQTKLDDLEPGIETTLKNFKTRQAELADEGKEQSSEQAASHDNPEQRSKQWTQDILAQTQRSVKQAGKSNQGSCPDSL